MNCDQISSIIFCKNSILVVSLSTFETNDENLDTGHLLLSCGNSMYLGTWVFLLCNNLSDEILIKRKTVGPSLTKNWRFLGTLNLKSTI